jgi:hypothetical protein
MEEYGPAREIPCALCSSLARLIQSEHVEGAFGGSQVVMKDQSWWYECPNGHVESLEDAERRLASD